jgi:hypothetical protein
MWRRAPRFSIVDKVEGNLSGEETVIRKKKLS